MEDIISQLIPIVGFICLVFIIRIVVEGRLRRRLAETHAGEELVNAMLRADETNRHQSSLKWGIVLAAVGVAFVLVDIFGLTSSDPAAFGFVIGAAGVGMLAYHALKNRSMN